MKKSKLARVTHADTKKLLKVQRKRKEKMFDYWKTQLFKL